MELTAQQYSLIRARRSVDDLDLILTALETEGGVTVSSDVEAAGEEAIKEGRFGVWDAGESIDKARKSAAEVTPEQSLQAEVDELLGPREAEGERESSDENGNGGEKLPSTHAELDALAAERGIDLGDANTVAEKQERLSAR